VSIPTEVAVRKWLLDGNASSGSGNNWYYRLRSKLEEIHYIRNVDIGEATSGKSANAGRKVVLSICSYLLRHGFTKTDVLRRYAFATSRTFAGRTAEFKRLSYDPSYWDDEAETLFTDWADFKNKKADRTTGTVDYLNFEICWVHALACLIIVTGGRGHSNFMCQELADILPFHQSLLLILNHPIQQVQQSNLFHK